MLAAVVVERHMQHTQVPNKKVFGNMSKPTLQPRGKKQLQHSVL